MTAIARTHRGDCPQMQRALSAYLSTRTEAIDELLRQLGDEGEMSERQVDAIGAAMRGFQNATEGCSEARLSIVGLLGPLLEGARR